MAFDIKEDQVPAALGCNASVQNERLQRNHALQEQSSSVCRRAFTGSKIIGAVNTIVNEDGKLVGHITDGIGFVPQLKRTRC